jgi:hypothetical protein
MGPGTYSLGFPPSPSLPLRPPSLPLLVHLVDRGLSNAVLGLLQRPLARHPHLEQQREPASFVVVEPVFRMVVHAFIRERVAGEC